MCVHFYLFRISKIKWVCYNPLVPLQHCLSFLFSFFVFNVSYFFQTYPLQCLPLSSPKGILPPLINFSDNLSFLKYIDRQWINVSQRFTEFMLFTLIWDCRSSRLCFSYVSNDNLCYKKMDTDDSFVGIGLWLDYLYFRVQIPLI